MASELEMKLGEGLSRAARKRALQDDLARLMFLRAGLATGALAAALLCWAAGFGAVAAACSVASAAWFIAGAWSAIQRDCVEDHLGPLSR